MRISLRTAFTCLSAGVCLLVLCSPQQGRAQRLQTHSSVLLHEGKGSSEPVITFFGFPNINQQYFFEDRKLRRQIDGARSAGDRKLLEQLLTLYVRNFGVGNFKQGADLGYIWELGQLLEARGDTTKALFFFNIALKNQGRWADSVRVHIDALTSAKAVRYVDLDYYYEIVAQRQAIDTLKPPKGVYVKLDSTVNSEAPDYAPYLYPKGNLLLFSSRRSSFDKTAPDYIQNEDIYFSQINPFGGGTWELAERLPDAINSPFNEGSASLGPDALTIYFSRCNAPDGLGVCDLYYARYDLETGQWVDVQNLGPDVNSPAWDSHPYVSQDDQTLFFCSNRDGGFGGIDLYLCRRQPNGTWGAAENLGPVINTLYNEVTPFLHPINNTLYFSSTGHLHNSGGFDIFKSRWAYNHWEEPRNLGPLVNTARDEYYFTIDGKGENLFFANEQPDDPRNFDIFTYPMPMEARPDAVVKFGGYLIDSLTGYPLRGIVAAIDLEKGVEISPVYINPSGYFEFSLINNRRYLIAVIGEDFLSLDDEELDLSIDSLFALLIRSALDERSLVFRKVQFQLGSAEVTPNALGLLEDIAQFLKTHPFCKLHIRGHTDNNGDPQYNLQLSLQRAENIQRFILGYAGVPDSLVTAEGFGETRPIYPNDTEAHRAKNRRVEFELVVPAAYRAQMFAEIGEELLPDTDTDADPVPATEPPVTTATPDPVVPTDTAPTPTETTPAVPEPSPAATTPTGDDDTDEDDPFGDDWDDDWGDLDLDLSLDESLFDEYEDALGDEDLIDVEGIAIDILEEEEDDRADELDIDTPDAKPDTTRRDTTKKLGPKATPKKGAGASGDASPPGSRGGDAPRGTLLVPDRKSVLQHIRAFVYPRG